MRPLLFSMLLCLVFTQCFAQKIRFTDTSNKWIYTVRGQYLHGGIIIPAHSLRDYFDGDTIVNGKQYQTFCTYVGSSRFVIRQFLREDTVDKKIYLLSQDPRDTADESVYIDYNLKLGDTIYIPTYQRIYNGIPFFVTAVDSVQINNTYHNRFTLSTPSFSLKFIEGVHNYNQVPPGFAPTIGVNFLCFYNQGTQPLIPGMHQNNQGNCSDSALSVLAVERKRTQPEVFPQPAADKISIRLPYQFVDGQLRITNLQGRTVYRQHIINKDLLTITPQLPGGLYIYYVADNATGNTYNGKLVFITSP